MQQHCVGWHQVGRTIAASAIDDNDLDLLRCIGTACRSDSGADVVSLVQGWDDD
jgi:hypothetical protein